jgi:hypothetical protein
MYNVAEIKVQAMTTMVPEIVRLASLQIQFTISSLGEG